MRVQLRSFYPDSEMDAVYSGTYDHTRWDDHIERVAKTIQVLDDFAAKTSSRTIADLSCGDAAIVQGSHHPWENKILDDLKLTGPIEETLPGIPSVDMFLLSETLEHVKDPDRLLFGIREKAKHMLLTTPYGEEDASNPEHYWGWDTEGVFMMLRDSGWTNGDVELFKPVAQSPYTFQIWRCS